MPCFFVPWKGKWPGLWQNSTISSFYLWNTDETGSFAIPSRFCRHEECNIYNSCIFMTCMRHTIIAYVMWALPAGVLPSQDGGQSAERGRFEQTAVASEVRSVRPEKDGSSTVEDLALNWIICPCQGNFMDFGRMRIYRFPFLGCSILGEIRICCSSFFCCGCLFETSLARWINTAVKTHCVFSMLRCASSWYLSSIHPVISGFLKVGYSKSMKIPWFARICSINMTIF